MQDYSFSRLYYFLFFSLLIHFLYPLFSIIIFAPLPLLLLLLLLLLLHPPLLLLPNE